MAWLKTEEAAELLGITIRTLRQWTAEGRISAYRVGRRLLYDAAEVDAFVRRQPKAR